MLDKGTIGCPGSHVCLEPTKNQTPKYLRLPKVIFNDINLIVPVALGKEFFNP
jgi:hypothetical protein